LAALAKLKEQAVSLHMIDLGGDVTGNGISKLVFTILSAVAEAERDRIRERITTVKADQRLRGRHLGGDLPFGYTATADGMLVEIPEQQAAIRQMLERRRAGESLRTIADAMKAAGFNVSHVAVQRIVAPVSRTVLRSDGRRVQVSIPMD
jgi:DNA invertase Pin-like site-specific DNA recombinase